MRASPGGLTSRVARAGGRPSLLLDFVRSGALTRAVVRGDATISFTRDSPATHVIDGVVHHAAAGVPRFHPKKGLLIEGAATTLTPRSRRLDDAGVWTPSDVSTAAVQGVDGVAGSATRITATGDGGTILGGTNTAGSAARRLAPFIRRVAGTGELRWTLNGGGNYTAFSGITSAWQRIEVGATVANPRVGFQIQASGDAFDVDFAGGETGSFATSPIESGAENALREVDMSMISAIGDSHWFQEIAGTWLVKIDTLPIAADKDGSTNRFFLEVSDDAHADRHQLLRTELQFIASAVLQRINGLTLAEERIGYAYATDNVALYSEGVQMGALLDMNPPLGLTTVFLGVRDDGHRALHTYLGGAAYWPRRLRNVDLKRFTQ
ncbi:MAG: hypothetical protein AB7N54_13130 [Alphaproteobacteria bacterium]